MSIGGHFSYFHFYFYFIGGGIMRKLLMLGTTLFFMLASSIGVSYSQITNEGMAHYRLTLYHVIGHNIEVLAGMAKGDIEFDEEKAVHAAELLHMISKALPETFVEGSYDETRVSPAIEDKRDTFDKAMLALQEESAKMIDAAHDLKTLRPQVGKLGNTCKSCHDDFRLEK